MTELYHYGIKRRSGRYPYGSGDRPFQRLEGRLRQQLDENDKNRERLKIEAQTKKIGGAQSGLLYLTRQYSNNQKAASLFNDYLTMAKELNIEMDKDVYNRGIKYYQEFVDTQYVFNYVKKLSKETGQSETDIFKNLIR